MELSEKKQYATTIKLDKEFDYMYENFIFSSQSSLYVFLEQRNEIIESLHFPFKIYKYGYPNDEVGMPSKINGIEMYGVSEIHHSEWIKELLINNQSHPSHRDTFYNDYKHYVIRFKDVTLEVIAKSFEIFKMTSSEFEKIVQEELSNILKN